MFFVDVAEGAGITSDDLVILQIFVQAAAYKIGDQIAFESHQRKLSDSEVERHKQAHEVLLYLNELLQSRDTIRDLVILKAMADYALAVTESPLCVTGDNCRDCWGCNEWWGRTETLRAIADNAHVRHSRLLTVETIACSYCELLAVADDEDEQAAHLKKRHADSIDASMRANGFVKGRDGQWHDGWSSD